MTRAALLLGSVFAFLSVAAGAFGAHALRERLDAYSLGVWNTAAQYQMVHAIALLLVGVLGVVTARFRTVAMQSAAWCFGAGILIFSGSLYVLAISGLKWLGAITPIGGLLFLSGWAIMAVAVLRIPGSEFREQ